MTTRRALWALIGFSTAFRLVCAASLGGYANEAWYYLYARNLDWGYFDHPPMVAAVGAVGLKLAGGVSPIFGARLGFILLFAGSTWLLARLTTRCFGAKAGVLAALVLNATVFYSLKIATFVEPDGPLLFFWLLALDRLWVALEEPRRFWAWFGVGLAWGGAMLSKYHAVLLPCGAVLYLLLRPQARRCLRQPGPYLAAAVGLAVFAPVVVWNARHGWVSFLYQGARAGGAHGLHPAMLMEALIGQFLYLTPWIWAGLVLVLVRLVRRGPWAWSESEAFLFCQAVPALGLFLGVSLFQRIMPHWPLIGFVALMPILGRRLAERLTTNPAGARFGLGAMAAAPLVLAVLFVTQANMGLFQDGSGRLLGRFRPISDPTLDTIRWDQIARALERRGLLADPDTFLFTDNFRYSAELALATRQAARVACYHRDARNYVFWSRPEDWVGRNGVFVKIEESLAKPDFYAHWFSRIEPLATIPIVRAGVTMETVRVYRCVQQTDPFAFGYHGPGHVPWPDHGPAGQQQQPILGQLSEPQPMR